jgi:hypothetical protein
MLINSIDSELALSLAVGFTLQMLTWDCLSWKTSGQITKLLFKALHLGISYFIFSFLSTLAVVPPYDPSIGESGEDCFLLIGV